MNLKEIVFISNFLGDGGAARVITVLADSFADKNYQVTICSFPAEKDEYPHSRKISYIRFQPKRRQKFAKTIERIWLLRRELKKHPSATIISFEYFMNMQTIIARFGLRNRLIISERNDPARVGAKFPISLIRDLLYRFCDVLVCQTPDAKNYFPKGIQKRSVVIPNPIKDGLPEPWQGKRSHEIVNFCRLEKQKNIPLLIDAFLEFHKTHQDYKLLIYGNGKERENIEKYIVEKKLTTSVILHEAVPNIHERILKCAMYVSSSDYEGLSNSMIEAMAIGLPTICTDCPCGGARMMIRDGENGLLVSVNNMSELEKAMTRIASDQKFAQKLSASGTKVREKLNSEQILNYWREVME